MLEEALGKLWTIQDFCSRRVASSGWRCRA